MCFVAVSVLLNNGTLGLQKQANSGANGTHWHFTIATSVVGLWS